jgi:FixJ family two-component response regulator
MSKQSPLVYVVEDDSSVREALESLIRSVGFRVQMFTSARDFLREKASDEPACLILDVRLPGLSGLELQQELARADIRIPIIFLTGHGDIPMTVKAMKAGALEFLTKPFRDQDLLDAIDHAIEKDRVVQTERRNLAYLRRHFDSLTQREREVMQLVISGLLNKQIASMLGTSETTIKVHRKNIMRKMKAGSLADLVRMAEHLGIRSEHSASC